MVSVSTSASGGGSSGGGASGVVLVGQMLTIQGVGFARAGCLQCAFLLDSNNNTKSSNSPILVVSEYMATCPIPTVGVGATSVLIRTCQGQGLGSAVDLGLGSGSGSASGFVFPLKVVSAPVVSSVYPPSGPVQGGFVVTVRGSGFMPEMDIVCSFGNTC